MIYKNLTIQPGMLSMIDVTYETHVKKFDMFIEDTGWVRDGLRGCQDGARGVVLVNTDDPKDTLFVPFYQYLVRLGDDLLVYSRPEVIELFGFD